MEDEFLNSGYPNWPATGEIPKMGVPRKLTDKELKEIDEMMHGNKDTLRIKEVMGSLSKDMGQVIWIDKVSSLTSVTRIKIPRKLKKQMKKVGSWNNPVIEFSGEATEYNIKSSDRAVWLGL